MSEILVKSIKKALDALDTIAEASLTRGGATLSEVATTLGENQPTLRNILRTMEACGYLGRNEKRYTLGPRCGDLLRCGTGKALLTSLSPRLEEAARTTGESFVLTTMVQGRRQVLSRHQGSSEVGVNLGATEGKSVYSLVTTRIMLANASPEEQDDFIAHNGSPESDWPETKPQGLAPQLSLLKTKGVADFKNDSLFACAVPVLDNQGVLLGAIGAYAPMPRTTTAHRKALIATLKSLTKG